MTRYFQVPHSVSISTGSAFRAGIARVTKPEDAALLAKAKGVVEVSEEVEARRNFREAGGEPKVSRGRFFKVAYRLNLHPSGKSYGPGVHEVSDPELIQALVKAKGVEETTEARANSQASLFAAIDKVLDAEGAGMRERAAAEAKKAEAERLAAEQAEAERLAAEQKAAEEEAAAKAKAEAEEAQRAAAEAKAMEEAAAEQAVSKKPSRKSKKSK